MKSLSYIFAFIFIMFLFTPSIIALVDRNVDISLAYNVNEEENSSKNQINFEFHIQEMKSNEESISFLKEYENDHYYYEKAYWVVLNVLSPPPKQA